MAKHKQYAITDGIHPDFSMYLAWNAANGGYFWTWRDVVHKLRSNSTKEHPFLFSHVRNAEQCIKRLKLPKKCIVIEWLGK